MYSVVKPKRKDKPTSPFLNSPRTPRCLMLHEVKKNSKIGSLYGKGPHIPFNITPVQLRLNKERF